MAVKVAINGYGTIGKRVADAVRLQPDMEVIGVVKTRPTYEATLAMDRGFPLYASTAEKVQAFTDAGIEVKGTLDDLLKLAEVVVDCTPNGVGAAYADTYRAAGVKAIFQGGEKHHVAGTSFNAHANYDESKGKDLVRVVSCNTTGLCRTLAPVKDSIGIDSVMAVMVRRSADPWDSKKGPINAIEPVLKVPSHHGPDVMTCIPDLPVDTMAVKVPTTLMHLHTVTAQLSRESTTEEVLSLWEKTNRVKLVAGGQGVKSTAQIMEVARDMGRPYSDLYEIAVWRDGVKVDGKTLYYYQAIHQESDVIPDNIDCIRAMTGLADSAAASMKITDETMAITS